MNYSYTVYIYIYNAFMNLYIGTNKVSKAIVRHSAWIERWYCLTFISYLKHTVLLFFAEGCKRPSCRPVQYP